MTTREEATARLAEALRVAHRNRVPTFEELARIAIEEGVVPVWEEAPPFYADGRLCTKPIPWSAICPEEK